MIDGRCLCGRVTVSLQRLPDYINLCNCRLCRASGAAWSYFERGEVEITGVTHEYRREDIKDNWLSIHYCRTCGTTTHYDATPEHPSDRIGMNTRLFAQDDLAGVPVKWQDGRGVEDENDRFTVTGTGHIGDGKAF
ncbi:GFA family protein [Croceicoccus naphthovorans]|uniref:GFA family protein n=1 Tax=Croceicoccus naphthovorans TaxID=1348774 RepID=UPI0009E34E24|nr:GFA family protein [Croceicoccus naphthovorans]MBB3989389.1 hypothetical protein [Croceicoccus naphthovorans]